MPPICQSNRVHVRPRGLPVTGAPKLQKREAANAAASGDFGPKIGHEPQHAGANPLAKPGAFAAPNAPNNRASVSLDERLVFGCA